MPHEREARGLLALLLFSHSRSVARTDAYGRLLPIEEQNRGLWDWEAIEEGSELLLDASGGGSSGRYELQAEIASVHALAPRYGDTDWPRILELYDQLLRVWPTPVVKLNRAVALAMVHGPEVALAVVEELEDDSRLSGYHYLPAVKADLLRRLGRNDAAAVEYREAIEQTNNAAERDFLLARLATLYGESS